MQEITLWRKADKGAKNQSPHVPNHLVSGEGGPKAAEPPRATPTTPETATFEDFQREEADDSGKDDEPSLPPGGDGGQSEKTTAPPATETAPESDENEPLVESSTDPPLPQD